MKRAFVLGFVAVVLTLTCPASRASDSYLVEEIKLPKNIAPEIDGLAFNSKAELLS